MATAAFRESGGSIGIITDEEIFEAHRWLASNEGLFVEPASAISVAALLKCRPESAGPFCPLPELPENAVIVCTLTGHGLKDTGAVLNDRLKPVSAPTDKSAILSILEKVK
jgi:threonine synthase